MTTTKQKTAAIYARFSSDMQKDRSIDDQFALCERYATREGFKVTRKFSDRAKSGARMFDRDGLLDLRTAAKTGAFDVVIVESLDRLSRDQEDLAGLFKRLKHYGVALLTVNEGVTTDIHVGIRGIMGAMYLKDLGDKIKRAQIPLVQEGSIPGTVTYGYDRVVGKPGERVINQAQAKIIRRIFTEYANGLSPRKIAAGLTHDRVPTPSGGAAWNYQSLISGGGKARGGILGNRLYVGELIWNQHYTVKDPDTGVESKRPRPKGEHITVAVPHLRIIDDKLWGAAEKVRNGRSVAKYGLSGKIVRHHPVVARSQHLLSGLLRCGACNGHMIVTKMSGGKRYVTCSAAFQKATCSHRKSYVMNSLQELVLDGMRNRLTDPKAITEAARVYHSEYQAQSKKQSAERQLVEKNRNRLVVQIERLVAAISDSDEPLPGLLEALKTKETERVGLEERLRQLKGHCNVVALHPNVMSDYRANVEKLHAALSRDTESQENRLAFHNMIDSIVVHPTEYRAPYEVSVYGRLSAMLGVDLFPTARSNAEILAAEGFSRADKGNPG
jgi:site-specific DNA recombinase